MASVNKVFLLGNVTRDPQLKSLPSGTQVCEFGMAMNRKWIDKETGEKREAPTFVDCKVMGASAEVIHRYVDKGDPLFVEGSLDYQTWEKDGQRRSKLEVFVTSFQLLGGRKDEKPRQDQRASAPMDDDTPF